MSGRRSQWSGVALAALCGSMWVDSAAAQSPLARTIRVPQDYPTIQAAVDISRDGDVVLVADGVYSGAGNVEVIVPGLKITIRSENGPSNCRIEPVIDVEDAFILTKDCSRDTVIEGFTIIGGRHGIVSESDGTPTIRNCVVQEQSEYGILHSGGGLVEGCRILDTGLTGVLANGSIELIGSEVARCSRGVQLPEGSVRDCYIHSNESPGVPGGGIYVIELRGPLQVVGTVIENNRAQDGAGLFVREDRGPFPIDIRDCAFDGNMAESDGGAAYLGSRSSWKRITNCLLTNNRAARGGAIFLSDATPVLMSNCTLVDNTAQDGGGVFAGDVSGRVFDSILWGNRPNQLAGWPDLPVLYSNVQGGYPGKGNIDADPLFVRGPEGDYYLSHIDAGQPRTSPCVDAGADPAAAVGMDRYTTRTDERRDTGMVDMGYHAGLANLCGAVNRMKSKCVRGSGRFKLKATLVTELEPGTELTMTRDDEEPKTATVKGGGRARASWRVFEARAYDVCVVECPSVCRGQTCQE